MNIFVIPSWYPSEEMPHTGIFFKEQAEALASVFPDCNFAISTWGSHESSLLLYGKDHFRNIPKLLKYRSLKPTKKQLKPNLTEYYTPAFTWSRKILDGNIKGILKSNEKHFLAFQQEVGKIDVIHAHSAHPAGWIAMELAYKYKLTYIITEHIGPFPSKYYLLRSGEMSHYIEKPFSRSYANIAVSPQLKETLERWAIPSVRYIPNLTNEDFYSLNKEKIDQNQPFTFFNLARLEDGKGLPYLLRAFKTFNNSYPESILKIGGGGSQQEAYKALAEELGISGKIDWLGVLNRDETLAHYHHCHAFVLPSLHENLPLVLLEAISCGKPIIGTRCGGPESIINEKNGILVEPGNEKELLKAMQLLYTAYRRYNEQEIRGDFCKRYSRKVVGAQIMEVYKSAASDKRFTNQTTDSL